MTEILAVKADFFKYIFHVNAIRTSKFQLSTAPDFSTYL